MSAPAFITTPRDEVVNTANLVAQARGTLMVLIVNGDELEPYAYGSAADAQAAVDDIADLLEAVPGLGSVELLGMLPASKTVGDGDLAFTVYGRGFRANAPVLTFYTGRLVGGEVYSGGSSVAISLSYTDSHTLTGTVLAAQLNSAASYDLQYSDGDGNTSAHVAGGFITYASGGGGGTEMQPNYGTNDNPNGHVTPADITQPAYYIGNNRTWYVWDTVGQATWIGLIVV